MKIYKFLFALLVTAAVSGCYNDDTNRTYKTLDLPLIDNPDKDPLLFVPNMAYNVVQLQELQITPNVVYKDMDDLSYEWIINGESVSTTKDLHWVCRLEKEITPCVYKIHRKSAGNATIFSFSLKLSLPLVKGFSVLVEQEGKLRYDFISETIAGLYTFDYNESAHLDLLSFTGNAPRVQEYWSCEKSDIVGEVMLLDPDPNNCISFDGETLLQAMTLPQEFRLQELPENFRVKDFLHGGIVSYVLADDGRIFQRRGSRVYYTGKFNNLPMRYNNKDIHGLKFINTKYNTNFGLIYDRTDDGDRFLLVNFDYNTGADYKAPKAGILSEFPAASNMSGIKGYELVSATYVRAPAGGTPSLFFVFRKDSDDKYYAREVSVNYNKDTFSVTTTEVFTEVYRVLPDFGADSKLCVIDPEGGSMFNSSYIYYTSAADPLKVYVQPRTTATSPTEFHTFDKKVTGIVRGTISRTSGYLLFSFEDNSMSIYVTAATGANPSISADYMNFDQERILETYQADGPIRWIGYKFGKIASY